MNNKIFFEWLINILVMIIAWTLYSLVKGKIADINILIILMITFSILYFFRKGVK